MENRDELIRTFFNRGYSYFDIQVLLSLENGIDMSLRQLKRHLKRLGLKRKGSWPPAIVQSAIQAEVQGSGLNLGCRAMARRLLTKHGISVGSIPACARSRGSTKSISPLSCREYMNKGPNFLIHTDGYDKVKRYGFAIHGAICGFSRRLLWLKVARTNNDPRVVDGYYLQYVKEIKGVPRCIRMDAGTENVQIISMQKALRWHHGDRCSGEKSIIVGSSHSNQRIEAWWRQLRRMCINFWMETFAKMENEQLLSTSESMDIERLRFCFMEVIQKELDIVRMDWNEHRVRNQDDNVPCGKPEMLYKHPELYGAVDYKYPVDEADIEAFEQFCKYPTRTGCSEEMNDVFMNIMTGNQLQFPDTVSEAMYLFTYMKTCQNR